MIWGLDFPKSVPSSSLLMQPPVILLMHKIELAEVAFGS